MGTDSGHNERRGQGSVRGCARPGRRKGYAGHGSRRCIPECSTTGCTPHGSRITNKSSYDVPADTCSHLHLFHQSFLKKVGVRTTIAVSGGTIILSPAELTVNITRVSRGTRQEVARFLSGRFPLGAKIDGQLYTSAVLVETVLSRLPGTVKISY